MHRHTRLSGSAAAHHRLLLQSCERPAVTSPTETAIGSSEEAASPGPGALTGPVTHVRDGDTIEVAGKPVRLQGLNCNERGTALGEAASTTMSRLVASGQVTCELSGETTYDREAGTCFLPSGEDLASILIRRGICGRCARHDPEGRYVRDQAQAGPFQGGTPADCRK